MDKMTKKEFKELHANNKIMLLVSAFYMNKETVREKLKLYEKDIDSYAKPVSAVNVENDKDHVITSIYKDGRFLFVEDIIDNSKSRTCSWNTLETNTIAYLLKD